MTMDPVARGLGARALGQVNALRTPVNVIFDTDLASDCDDATDLAAAMTLAQTGEATLAAVLVGSSNSYSAPCAHAMLSYGGLGATPLGAYQGSLGTNSSTYAQTIAQNFGRENRDRTSYSSAVSVARQVMAKSAAKSIVYVSLGNLQNLSDILQSPADSYSSLTGFDLFARTVSKLVIMAGDYPASASPEFNMKDVAGASAFVFDNCPVDIYAVGYTLGLQASEAPPAGADPAVNPFKKAYDLDGHTSRPAWGGIPLLYAVRGVQSGVSVASSRGFNTVNGSTGANSWAADANGNCFYLGLAASGDALTGTLNDLIAAVSIKPTIYSSLNPFDRSDAALKLSSANRTVTADSNTARQLRGKTAIVNAQKKYWEFQVGQVTGTTNALSVGVSNANHALTQWLGGDANSFGFEQDGVFKSAGSAGTSPGAWVTGDVIRACYDRANQRLWLAVNSGQWNGSGTADPATNVGGYNCGGLNDAYPTVYLTKTGDGVTCRFDPTTWTYSAPSGFSALRA